ncbi:hemerythrin domain-containing protein [Sciscionella sediminilitoris]|uniref:hemerythrin domain-containing protein n=1 Tax=Sciscionella sediminilitoris TaxID=1445613 RepID=UPI0004DFA45A|nr:hemerythrin domain-containing protein [Sciscionella sp. SE31]
MNALDLLAEDHQRLMKLLDEVEHSSTEKQLRLHRRTNLLNTIIIMSSAHQAIQEKYFWPLVRTALPDGKRIAETAIEHEYSTKRLLDEVRTTKPGQADYAQLVDQLLRDLRAHVDYEQDTVWPRVRKFVDESTLQAVGAKMQAAKTTAPTRPHPNIPPQPLLWRSLGACVAALDRARDALNGRREHTAGR